MILPPAMSLEEKWGYLSDPPDLTAQSIMTEGLKAIFHIAPPLKLFPSAEEITLDCNIPALKPFIEDWLARGIIKEIKDPQALFLFPPLHNGEKVREVASHNRPIHLEQVDLHPQVQNGDSRENYQVDHRGSLGYLDRRHRRLSSCSHSSCLQEILCVQLCRETLLVSQNAFWLDNGSLGVFQSHETNKKIPASSWCQSTPF